MTLLKPEQAARIYAAFEAAVAAAHARPVATLKYRKIWNVVHITGRVDWPAPPSGTMVISGLPFTVKAPRQ